MQYLESPINHAPTYIVLAGSRICAVELGMTVTPSTEVFGPYVPSPAIEIADSHESATTFVTWMLPRCVAPCGLNCTVSCPFLQVTPSAVIFFIGVKPRE